MNKLDLETKNVVDDNIEKIGAIFPNIIVESENGQSIDFDLLKQELSKVLIEGNKEKYQLTWPGKKESIVNANTPTTKTLRPIKEKSVDFDKTENVYIEGDNLEVLKILQESYLNKIKCIYIDPPYNTGNDFIYNDKFLTTKEKELENSGQMDENGNRMITNSQSNGRFHSDWLSMMYSRLKLARNLMKDDGFLFISIDDKELFNLKKICDEIYGENNYINTISLNAKVSAGASGGGEDKRLKKNIEYVLVYIKNIDKLEAIKPIYKNTELSVYIEKMKIESKSFKYINILYRTDDEKYCTTIKDGSGDDITISKINNYEIKTIKQVAQLENLTEKEVYEKYIDKVMTTTNAQTSIRQKVWDATKEDDGMFRAKYISKSGKNKGKVTEYIFVGKQKVLVIWLKDTILQEGGKLYKQEKIGTYWDGFSWINVTKEGMVRFENGKKPIDFINQIVNLTNIQDGDMVLDFFSGSGSTGHAIMEYNKEHNKKVKYILIQIKEEIKDKEYLNYLKNENIEPYVPEVAQERIRRAGKKIKEENSVNIDYGFRVYKVDSSNMTDIYHQPNDIKQSELRLFEENIKEDRNSEDILTQVILDLGLTLDLKIEKKNINNNNVYFVADNSLIACFDNNININIIDEIVKYNPLKVVFRDSSFANDNDRINVEEKFKKYSPETEVSII